MKDNQILRMAQEAGLEPNSYSGYLDAEEVEHFASLVASAERRVWVKLAEKYGAEWVATTMKKMVDNENV